MSEYKFGDPVWVLYGSSGRLKALVLNQPPNSDTAYVAGAASNTSAAFGGRASTGLSMSPTPSRSSPATWNWR